MSHHKEVQVDRKKSFTLNSYNKKMGPMSIWAFSQHTTKLKLEKDLKNAKLDNHILPTMKLKGLKKGKKP